MFSKVCVFAVIKNASINDSCLHNRFDAFSTAHTKTFQKYSIARRDVSGTSMHMLQTQKALMFLGIVFVLMHCQPFSTRTGGGGGSTPANTIRGRFRFYRLSRAFSNRCVLEENAQRVSVGENLNTSKCTD